MGNFDISIDVDTHGIENRIQRAIAGGVKDAARDLDSDLQDKAERKIIQANAIWRENLISSFESEIIRRPDGLWIKLRNISDHAGPVEDGAVYTDRGPPVHALLPWVRENLHGFEVTGSGGLNAVAKSGNLGAIMHPDFPGYTIGQVDKAFWLQAKIRRDGIVPVGYMAYAANWARANGHEVVSSNVATSLRKYGLL